MSLPNRVVALALTCGILAACTAQQQQSARQTVNSVASSAPGGAKDALIATGVSARLAAIDVDAATSVHTSVRDGTVTLSGEARSRQERTNYERAARSIDGVTGVVDNVRVNPHLRGAREALTDAVLQTKVAGAIAAQTGVNVFHVKTSAHNGVVTLTGNAASRAIKETMLASVKKVNGVTRIIDNIQVKP